MAVSKLVRSRTTKAGAGVPRKFRFRAGFSEGLNRKRGWKGDLDEENRMSADTSRYSDCRLYQVYIGANILTGALERRIRRRVT